MRTSLRDSAPAARPSLVSPMPTGVSRRPMRAPVVTRAESGGDGGKARAPWDFGRFVSTLMFFNKPPTPAEAFSALASAPGKLLGGLLSGDVESRKSAALTVLAPGVRAAAGAGADAAKAVSGGGDAPQGGVVMVTGATGGVGKRVVRLLLECGASVRVLVRDLPKAEEMLVPLTEGRPGRLEAVAGDVTQAATLLPEYFEGVTAVVCCTAVKVAPKEGDTANREKYYQGIKFYDPQIVGDTPESVEFRGMQHLVEKVAGRLGQADGLDVFYPAAPGAAAAWGALDDVVMGGVSESRFEVLPSGGEDGGPVGSFSGVVRTENSGGFTSARTRNFEPLLDLAPYSGLTLRVKGDGQRYKLILRSDPSWDGISYCRSFDTVAGEWQTLTLPFDSFSAVFRAKTLPDAPPLPADSVSSLQLMLSKFEYDGELNPSFRAGEFSLLLGSVRATPPEPLPPRFVHVSSAGVTRPGRPGIDVNAEPPAVRMNEELGGILTYKLKGEDVLRESGLPYAIVRPTALTEEPAGAELQFDQGDVIKGKISREDVAELCVALLEEPAALNTTFEVKSTVPFSTPWQPEPGSLPARDWHGELARAGLRRGVTGRTLDGVYTGREPEEAVLKEKAGAAV